MFRGYILFGVVCVSLFGCNPAKNRPSSASEGTLETPEMLHLQRINSSLNDVVASIQPASKPVDGLSLERSIRITNLKKMMEAGQCQLSSTGLEGRFDHPWSVQREVNSSGCPTLIYEYSEYKLEQRKWLFTRTLQPKLAEYRNMSGLGEVRARGSLQADAKGMVSGEINYEPFEVAGVGKVAVKIRAKSFPREGHGMVSVDMTTPGTSAKGVVSWNGAVVKFSINDAESDLKTFTALFSAFQPLEIMDRARNLR